MRLETPTLASPSSRSRARIPGAGRLLRRAGLVEVGCDAFAAVGDMSEPLFGRLALLPRRRLARRLGGSSETALLAFRTRVGLREPVAAGGVEARCWLRVEAILGLEEAPAGARGTLDVPLAAGALFAEVVAIFSFFGAGPGFESGSGVSVMLGSGGLA